MTVSDSGPFLVECDHFNFRDIICKTIDRKIEMYSDTILNSVKACLWRWSA